MNTKIMTKEDFRAAEKRARVMGVVGKVFVYLMLVIWALMVLFPFYWMILSSLKSFAEYSGELVPKFYTLSPTLENYKSALAFTYPATDVVFAKSFLNTLVFTLATTAIMLVVSILAAFAFARLDFKGKNLAFTLFLSLMMIPTELTVITNYVTVTNLELRNTFAGLILPSVASIFYIYLLKENFAQIPDELYLAAKVDGTTDMKYLFRVVVPICRPTVVTVVILKVIECWNSYVWPRLAADDPNYYLVSNGIQALRESGFGRENIPAMMAAVVIVSAPLIILFLIFRNKIMAGVSRGGLKG